LHIRFVTRRERRDAEVHGGIQGGETKLALRVAGRAFAAILVIIRAERAAARPRPSREDEHGGTGHRFARDIRHAPGEIQTSGHHFCRK
jgi:hypothetical protein